jgi:hypothetical protein
MAFISATYAGAYVTADDLKDGKHRQVVIASAEVETLGHGDNAQVKVVLGLKNLAGTNWRKKLPLNKTNAAMIAAIFGDDTASWHGRTIEVWAELVPFQGRLVNGLKARPVPSQSPAITAPSRGEGIPDEPDSTVLPPEPEPQQLPGNEGSVPALKPSPEAMYAVGGVSLAAPRERKPRNAYAGVHAKPKGKPRTALEDDLDDAIIF